MLRLLALLSATAFLAVADEILIIGGEYSSWTLQVFDPKSDLKNKLINGTSKEHVRLNHVGVVLPNSSIFIMGGRDMETKERLRSTALLHLNDGDNKAHFRKGPPMLDVRSGAAAVLLNGEAEVDGKMYAFGGESWQGDCSNADQYTLYNTAEAYDPGTKSWKLVKPMKTKRFLHTSAVYQGKVYVCGGQDGGAIIYNNCEVYDSKTDSWTDGPTMNRRRFGFGLVVLDNKLYAIGGSSIPYSKREFHAMDTTLYAVEWLEGSKWVRSTCGLLAKTYAPSVSVITDKEYRPLKQLAEAAAQTQSGTRGALTLTLFSLPLLLSLQ